VGTIEKCNQQRQRDKMPEVREALPLNETARQSQEPRIAVHWLRVTTTGISGPNPVADDSRRWDLSMKTILLSVHREVDD
jgi:hypothetical protein